MGLPVLAPRAGYSWIVLHLSFFLAARDGLASEKAGTEEAKICARVCEYLLEFLDSQWAILLFFGLRLG